MLKIDLYAIKCNSSTDNMFKIFDMIYKQHTGKCIQISKLGEASQVGKRDGKGLDLKDGRTANSAFTAFITNSATASLSQRYGSTSNTG